MYCKCAVYILHLLFEHIIILSVSNYLYTGEAHTSYFSTHSKQSYVYSHIQGSCFSNALHILLLWIRNQIPVSKFGHEPLHEVTDFPEPCTSMFN